MVVDLGHLHMKSDLVSKEEKEFVLKKQGEILTDEEFDKLKSMMFDKFTVQMQNMQASPTPRLFVCFKGSAAS
jgi:vacuolar protein sorting-associated protein 13A/C